jgi:hypothetical protein
MERAWGKPSDGLVGVGREIIQLYGYLDPKKMLEAGRAAAFLRQDQG